MRLLEKLRQGLMRHPRIHFLHIGKTGGTSVITALRPLRKRGRYHLKLHGHATRLIDVPQGEQIVFFLRDPLTRFVSGFYSRYRQGQPRNFYPWSPGEKACFERFPTPNQLALALGSQDAGERTAAENAMQNVYHLHSFCRDWFGNEEAFQARRADVFFIGFQETLAADFEKLKTKLGVPASVPLPTDEVAAHKTPEHFDKKLEPQAVENLRRWYGEDIRFYQLCQKIAAEIQAG
jgi:hypothetical protein